MMRRAREHFAAADVLEIDTPALSPFAVSDTQIESLEIAQSLASRVPLYLHTSPEYCMKRLLAAGYPDIYSICRVFRDGESGRRHQPEFTMIEWYRIGFGLGEIVDDTLALIDNMLGAQRPPGTAVQHDYRDVFQATTGADPLDASIDELAAIAGADEDLRAALGDDRDGWLDLLLSTRVAAQFEADRLTVLRHYPASQAALARLCPDDPQVADRFEVFLGGMELANGYVELTDADEQASRIERDNAERERRGLRTRPVDLRLLEALRSGLPKCSGVAMGFERLHMIHDQTDDIRDVLTFDFEADA